MGRLQHSSGVHLVVLLLLGPAAAPTAAAQQATTTAPSYSPDFKACLRRIGRPQQVVFPEDGARYNRASSTVVASITSKPSAVLFACNAAEVSAGVKCAAKAGIKISPACGRQGLTGRSVQDGYLTIDVSNITTKVLSRNRMSATIGAGNSGAMVQAWLYDQGVRDAALPSGSCTWVGVSGWLLGGGLGVLGRLAGLGCDSVTQVEVVLADGSIVKANATFRPAVGVLWWWRGSFGIATAFTLKLTRLPNNGKVTRLSLTYKAGADTTAKEFLNLQQHLVNGLDRRFGLDLLALGGGGGGPQLHTEGIFFGEAQEALDLLNQAGMLNSNLDNTTGFSSFYHEAFKAFPYTGLQVTSRNNLYDYYFINAPSWTFGGNGYSYTRVPADLLSGGFTFNPKQVDWLNGLLRGKPHVVGGADYNTGMIKIQARLVGILSPATVQALMQYIEEAQQACKSGKNLAMCTLSIGNHLLGGGAYGDKAPSDSAFPWRNKYYLIGAGFGAPTSMLPTVAAHPEWVSGATEFINRLEGVLNETAAYVNYQAHTLDDWQSAYFGSNYPRLQAIKQKYDPANLFGKPYTVAPSS